MQHKWAILAAVVSAVSIPLNVTAAQTLAAPKDALVTGLGQTVVPANPGTPAPPIQPSTAPAPAVPIYSWAKRTKALSNAQIEKQLDTLSNWSIYTSYQSFFLLLSSPQQTKIITTAAGKVAHDGLPVGFPLYKVGDPALGYGNIQVRFEKDLAVNPPFNGSPGAGLDRAQGNLFFTQISGFGNFLPANLADVAEGAFINGLVTRMVLGEYLDKVGGMPLDDILPPASNPLGSPSAAILPFETSGNWSADTGFLKAESKILQSNPIQGDAMLAGWYVGQEAERDLEVRNALWTLLGGRLGMKSLGECVGYTLTYLVGYGRNQFINQLANSPIGPAAGVSRSQFLLGQLGLDEQKQLDLRIQEAKDPTAVAASVDDPNGFVQDFYSAILSEELAVAARADIKSTELQPILGLYAEFLSGMESGSLKGAGTVYADVFNLAYGLGYEDGFNAGYAKGFSEGQAIGYRDGWNAANSRFSSMHHSGFFGHLGHFFSDVADVAKPVATIVTAVAPFFA